VIAANVRAAREAHGWSQDELAQKARLRRCRIDSLERGEAGRNLNLDNLGRLADALGIEPVDLCRRNRRP
jgi:transcriptional regulator with XRE-family HTH domain